MAYLTQYLDTIRGYRVISKTDNEEIRYYDPTYYDFNIVRDSIVSALGTVNFVLYPEIDIQTEIENIVNEKIGYNIRDNIYKAVKKIIDTTDKPCTIDLSIIRHAHYGSDMREPLYNILISLGAGRIDDIRCFSTSNGINFVTGNDTYFCVVGGD